MELSEIPAEGIEIRLRLYARRLKAIPLVIAKENFNPILKIFEDKMVILLTLSPKIEKNYSEIETVDAILFKYPLDDIESLSATIKFKNSFFAHICNFRPKEKGVKFLSFLNSKRVPLSERTQNLLLTK
ncbi:MAG: hypothetical protein WC634_04115 [archaeon]